MSRSHYIVIARNDLTGEIELPLENRRIDDMNADPVMGEYDEETIVRTCALSYGPEWTLSLYGKPEFKSPGRKGKA